MTGGVHVPVTVDATTVLVGDEIAIGGRMYTVRNLLALPRGGRRLEFDGGETFTMQPATVLYATRLVNPRRSAGWRGGAC
ncbi:hypothetical protein RM780_04455 [Streptomyces sp. DSM 44917]|uniref:Uncharacterized protein n=1 Tax=Streptomyces boetiae TaxID=3075541 RepID=A0ABU2L3T0_9ACTN|nr:hypothetical protein [Streptomyces sp. DSM 44917]MDT0306213.1 hypothetical protein [Streptomyces sp. DSM 44917]